MEGCVLLSCRGKQVFSIWGELRLQNWVEWGWGGRPQPAIGHVPRAFPVDTLLACTHFLSPFVSTLGPLLAVSWVCCLDALVCFSEDRPSVVLLAKLLLSVSLVTSGDVICLF